MVDPDDLPKLDAWAVIRREGERGPEGAATAGRGSPGCAAHRRWRHRGYRPRRLRSDLPRRDPTRSTTDGGAPAPRWADVVMALCSTLVTLEPIGNGSTRGSPTASGALWRSSSGWLLSLAAWIARRFRRQRTAATPGGCLVHQAPRDPHDPQVCTFGDLEPCALDQPVPSERRTVFCSLMRCHPRGRGHARRRRLPRGRLARGPPAHPRRPRRGHRHAAGTALSIAIDAVDWELADKVAGQVLSILTDPAGGAP